MSRRVILGITICIALATLGATGATWADECEATLDPQLYRVIKKDITILHRFKVEVSSPARCADVVYELTVVEEVTGGKKEAKKKSITTRVRDGVVTTAMVEHEMSAEKTMAGWKIELDKCKLCGAGKTD
jgi:hypothetical protein